MFREYPTKILEVVIADDRGDFRCVIVRTFRQIHCVVDLDV